MSSECGIIPYDTVAVESLNDFRCGSFCWKMLSSSVTLATLLRMCLGRWVQSEYYIIRSNFHHTGQDCCLWCQKVGWQKIVCVWGSIQRETIFTCFNLSQPFSIICQQPCVLTASKIGTKWHLKHIRVYLLTVFRDGVYAPQEETVFRVLQ